MDTRFDLWKQKTFGPRTSRFSWQLAVTEECNRQATESPNMIVPDLAGILLHLEAAKGATQIRPHELLCCTESRKNDCLFFECSKFRVPCNEALPSRYTLQLSSFCMSEVVGTAAAKPRFCMPTAFDKMNQDRGARVGVPLGNAQRDFEVL
jgi:hypothetical protein